MRFTTLAVVVALISNVLPGYAQKPETQARVEVLLIGTVHLDNPGRDVVNPVVPDVLASEQQRELAAIRKSLAQFRPTKVALEVRKRHQQTLDSLYQTFRGGRLGTSFAAGDFASTRSEHYQIGFRLAHDLNHAHVWAVDHALDMDFGKVLAYARQQDTSFVGYFNRFRKRKRKVDSLLQHGTLQDVYRHLNSPTTVQRYYVPYARMATVADDTTYVGPDVVASYYKRNLRIFANIEEIADPGDRLLVIFGAGHLPFLRPLIEASPQMTLVDPLQYL